MILSALIKKGGLSKAATATPATSATQETDQVITVASVATVAVASKSELSPNSKYLPSISSLTTDDELKIRSWLDFIEETDVDMISEVINKCHTCHDARQYYLKRAKEVEIG